jgi:hypothetical protein
MQIPPSLADATYKDDRHKFEKTNVPSRQVSFYSTYHLFSGSIPLGGAAPGAGTGSVKWP